MKDWLSIDSDVIQKNAFIEPDVLSAKGDSKACRAVWICWHGSHRFDKSWSTSKVSAEVSYGRPLFNKLKSFSAEELLMKLAQLRFCKHNRHGGVHFDTDVTALGSEQRNMPFIEVEIRSIFLCNTSLR